MTTSPKNIKITREELEKDEVLEFTDKALFWLRSNARILLGLLVAIFGVYAVAIAMKNHREKTYQLASDKLFEAMQSFDAALEDYPWGSEERASAMQNVRNMCDEIVAEFKGSEAARNALYLKGNAYYFQGDAIGNPVNTRQAIVIFTEYAEAAARRGDRFEQAAALLALGYAHENLYLLLTRRSQDEARAALAEAQKYYDQLANLADTGFLRAEALNAKARLLAFQGNTAEAEKLYRQVLKERGHNLAQPAPNAPPREQLMYRLRTAAAQFTPASTARIQLQRLGVDIDAETTPATP
jgi:tetratricopeptide (TPR) repeat protein